MANRHLPHGVLISLAIALAIGLAACTRSASTALPSPGAGEQSAGTLTGQQATMEAVRSALLTQTAQAAASTVPTEKPTNTPAPTSAATTSGAITPGAGTPAATSSAISGSGTYVVQPGEWVYSIARKFGVDPQAIIDLNNLVYPYTLSVGQELKIPGAGPAPASTNTPLSGVTPAGSGTPAASSTPGPSATPGGGTKYTVQPGEWVYSIARKFGVDPQAIIDANNLVYPYTLSVGQTLIIP
jgi:membrane-bound lytic murein transglycosylase D